MSINENSQDQKRRDLITAMLPHVAFDGWSREALYMAASDLDMPRKEADLLFPGSRVDMVLFNHRMNDEAMMVALEEADLKTLKIRERIATAVKIRLMLCENHKEALRKALTLMSMPQNSIHSMKAVYETVDNMWYAAGDTATDWNFYSKRGLLAGVYSSTLLFWLNDTSEDYSDSWSFLDRRIENVMQVPKVKAKAQEMADKFLKLPAMRRRAVQRFKAKA